MDALDIYKLAALLYVGTLVAMTMLVVSRADKPMLRVALVLLCNWAANQAFTDTTGLVSPWWFRLGVDALSAFALTVKPSCYVQARVSEFFIVMVVVSSVIGVGSLLGRIDPANAYLGWRYDLVLSAVGVAQLIYFVVGGGFYGGGKRNRAGPVAGRSNGLVMAARTASKTGQRR